MTRLADRLTLRPLDPAEFAECHRFGAAVFLADPDEDDRERELSVFEFDRSLAAFDGPTLVGSANAYTRQLTVPGGPTPVAAVSWVSVAPTHRRRGLLTAMMRRQLTEWYEEQREPVAVLWASEPTIYGRFGYGRASDAVTLAVDTRSVRLRPPAGEAGAPGALGGGALALATPAAARATLADVYERQRTATVGWLDRPGAWWDVRLFDPERRREGASTLRAVLHTGAAGSPDGYALYATKSGWAAGGPAGEVHVREVVAGDPAAYAALWRFLLELDLVRTVRYRLGGADEPLVHLVDNVRGLHPQVGDGLWVRLVDVPRALAARRYAVDVDVVLDVTDAFCPWNAGRYRLTGGPAGADCRPATGPADLAVDAATLAAAYLGGPTLAALAAAGRVGELRPGALAAASPAFAGLRQPHCPEIF